MKKRHITMACVALGIALLATGCKKEEVKDTFNLNAVIEEVKGTQKVHMEGLLPVWDNNDEIKVNGENCTVSITGSGNSRTNSIAKEEEEATYCAFYPARYLTNVSANITNHTGISITLPRRQDYIVSGGNQTVRMPMIAYSNTTDLHFKNLCSVLKVTVTNNTGHTFKLDSIEVTSDGGNLCGTGSVTLSGFTNSNTPAGLSLSGAGAGNKVTLCGAGKTSMNVTFTNGAVDTFYVVVPTVSTPGIFRFRLGIEEGFLINKKTNSTVSVARNSLIKMAFSAQNFEQPIDVILGPFSVSPTTKVSFSTGNLWYSRNDNGLLGDGKFHFEAAQWAYVPIASPNNYNNTFHISHFWWDTSASRSHEYYFNGFPKKNTDVIFTNHPNSRYMANPRFEVEGVRGKFRTLSADEWQYLIWGRNSRFGKYLSLITNISLGGGATMDGIIILPDTSTASFSNLTTIDAINDWGAAFLPVAGGRRDYEIYTFNDYLYGPTGNKFGEYWSSLCRDDVTDKAYVFSFTTNYYGYGYANFNCYGDGSRDVARALRLVCRYGGN